MSNHCQSQIISFVQAPSHLIAVHVVQGKSKLGFSFANFLNVLLFWHSLKLLCVCVYAVSCCKEISWFSNWAPNAALQVPGPFFTVCELRATDKQQSQLGPPLLMSSLTRKVGSKPDVRVNDLPGPPNCRRWTVDRATFEDGAWETPTGVCPTTTKCRQTSTQSSATTEEMLELGRYNTQKTAVSLSTKLSKSCSLAATTDLEPPGIKRRATAVDSLCCRSKAIQCDVSSGETQDSGSSRDGARGRWQAHRYIYIICLLLMMWLFSVKCFRFWPKRYFFVS